ncbi:acetyl esterase/lipase [Mobilisporobacter senegalensis]|uniref:Acetyl esterase/lipase n=1 Tax=Mobilisporobacter senegalensis TaxID=1329262 RepID=A0A3N1XXV4_9FIRM|nr:alpha/beta hydrolase [Mobilisporobacter senegalensis]ROR31453.1 acetyl esterase/lipase [Mobilisporobacter senegalensis]
MIYKEISVNVEGSMPYVKLCMYFLDNSDEIDPEKLRPLILICPGGGYSMTSDREAEAFAIQFMSMGYHAAVLRYSVAPARYPTSLLELSKSIAYLRSQGEEYHIDTDKIIVQGSSAGGHLAASLGVFWNREFLSDKLKVSAETIKPNGLILNYPVITSKKFAHKDSFRNLLGDRYDSLVNEMSLEDQISKDTPRTFIWHTFTDASVPVENSLLFVEGLVEHKIPTEFHMYPVGAHGLGLANELTARPDGYGIQKECESWIQLAKVWLNGLTRE